MNLRYMQKQCIQIFYVKYLACQLYYWDILLLFEICHFFTYHLCFSSKYNLLILVAIIRSKEFCKNVILRGQLVVFLSIILEPPLYCIGLLKKLLAFLVFSNKVILEGCILNVCKARLPKLVFHVVLSYKLPNINLWTIQIYLQYLLDLVNLK